MILGGQRGRYQSGWQPIRLKAYFARTEAGSRLVEHGAVSIENDRGPCGGGVFQQLRRERSQACPHEERQNTERSSSEDLLHGFTAIAVVAVRPNTSGS